MSVGYWVRSERGIQFRRWTTSQLQEHPCQCDAISVMRSYLKIRDLYQLSKKKRVVCPRVLFIHTGLDRVEDPLVLRFRYDYEDIPKGLIPRFIVKMRR